MTFTVRAVDVGSGNTKFVSAVAGEDVRCVAFPSIAYPSMDRRPGWPAGGRRRTLLIPIGSLFYEVGPDVALAADTFRARQLHDGYAESPEDVTLLRGTLAMMKLPYIDLLVVGLPVALFAGRKAALEKAMTGWHDIGDGKAVTVAEALAVAQAFMPSCNELGVSAALEISRSGQGAHARMFFAGRLSAPMPGAWVPASSATSVREPGRSSWSPTTVFVSQPGHDPQGRVATRSSRSRSFHAKTAALCLWTPLCDRMATSGPFSLRSSPWRRMTSSRPSFAPLAAFTRWTCRSSTTRIWRYFVSAGPVPPPSWLAPCPRP